MRQKINDIHCIVEIHEMNNKKKGRLETDDSTLDLLVIKVC